MKYKEFIAEQFKQKEVTFIFGRMNPPTKGHEIMVNFGKMYAKQNATEYIVYPSQTKDKKKNPLPIKDKVKWLKKFFRGIKIIFDPKLKTPFQIIDQLLLKFDRVHFVVGGDRFLEFTKLMKKYYDDQVVVVHSGGRVEGISATTLRNAVKSDDFKLFKSGLPSTASAKDAMGLFKQLKPILESMEKN